MYYMRTHADAHVVHVRPTKIKRRPQIGSELSNFVSIFSFLRGMSYMHDQQIPISEATFYTKLSF